MSTIAEKSPKTASKSLLPSMMAACQQILNASAEIVAAAADRSRFAGLPRRYLDDVGMTIGDRTAALRYEEPILNTWQAMAAH